MDTAREKLVNVQQIGSTVCLTHTSSKAEEQEIVDFMLDKPEQVARTCECVQRLQTLLTE